MKKNKNKHSRVVITLFKNYNNKIEKIKLDIESQIVEQLLVDFYQELNNPNIEYVHLGDTFVFDKKLFLKIMVYEK